MGDNKGQGDKSPAGGYGKCETAGCTCQKFEAKSGSAFQTCTCGHRDVAHEWKP
jgi:hypothetical protein